MFENSFAKLTAAINEMDGNKAAMLAAIAQKETELAAAKHASAVENGRKGGLKKAANAKARAKKEETAMAKATKVQETKEQDRLILLEAKVDALIQLFSKLDIANIVPPTKAETVKVEAVAAEVAAEAAPAKAKRPMPDEIKAKLFPKYGNMTACCKLSETTRKRVAERYAGMFFLVSANGADLARVNTETKHHRCVASVNFSVVQPEDMATLREFLGSYNLTLTKKVLAAGITASEAIKTASAKDLAAAFGC